MDDQFTYWARNRRMSVYWDDVEKRWHTGREADYQGLTREQAGALIKQGIVHKIRVDHVEWVAGKPQRAATAEESAA